ncbi:aldo/keto reductase [Cryobacterium sp. TMS1-13-1]|uniref:aldo/keto reductase n=1 Tax=Cryobacterium sp. TMS1-13-1 TaxID=1259220 RepID=UPI00106D3067|nr:aldo/keto reductase [Cryobacterium sp. TMS1-13-1]TFD23382.1 aldo/keto reductase [Cryobacterium sp. TMS1-13-1]
MKYVKLGTTGLDVSALALGCMSYGEPERGNHAWTLTEATSRPFIRQAVESGINFFDTANAYSAGSSEEILGRALAEYASRDEIVVATKVYSPVGEGPNQRGLSRKAVLQEIDNSLRRLNLDYVDLYIVHRFDPFTPLEETLEALHDVVRSGKARYLGASSMFAWQFAKALRLQYVNGWTPFVSMQSQYNLISREEEREMFPLAADAGIGLTPWSPLARGKLTRDWDQTTARTETDLISQALYAQAEVGDRAVASVVADIAAERGVPRAQVALAWVSGNPAVTAPIVGATKPQHLDDAIASLDLQLSADERARLEASYVPRLPEGF